MSRKSKLPKYVSRDRSRYVYKKYLGVINGKPAFGKPIRLCSLEAPLSEVWRAWERVQGRNTDSLKWLLTSFNASDDFALLAPATRDGYEGYKKVITGRKVAGGEKFGDTALQNISIPIRQKQPVTGTSNI